MSDVVAFLHSTGTNPGMWARLTPLVREVPVLAPANLGYPPNPPLPRGQTVTVQDDVAHFIVSLPPGTTGVHVVAHSYGGFVGLNLLHDARVRVRSLWLYEPVLYGALAHSPDTQASGEARLGDIFSARPEFLDPTLGGQDAWLRFFIDFWNRPGAFDGMPEAQREATRQVGWKMFEEVRGTSTDPRPFSAYRTDAPMTLVYGSTTHESTPAMVRALARVNPQAEVEAIEGAGHMAPATRPRLVEASLQKHLARVGVR
jgi:pimeloyl-ACP methyl ester carboxylesterase